MWRQLWLAGLFEASGAMCSGLLSSVLIYRNSGSQCRHRSFDFSNQNMVEPRTVKPQRDPDWWKPASQ